MYKHKAEAVALFWPLQPCAEPLNEYPLTVSCSIKQHVDGITIIATEYAIVNGQKAYTVKPVCNDHLYNKIYYLWFIQ